MPIDPAIALQYRPPQFESPMQTIGALMAVRGQTAEIALRQAQVQEQQALAEQNRLKAEQDRRDLQDASTLQEAMGNPDIAPKIAAGDLTPLYGKIQAKNLDTVRTNILKQHQEAATAAKGDLENRSTALNALAEGLQGLGEDPATINANITAFKTNPANQQIFRNAGIDPNTIPSVNTPEDLKKWEAAVGVAQTVTNKALALKGVQTKQGLEEAQAAEAAARTPGLAAESGIKQKQLEFMQNASTNGADSAIDARIDPKQFPEQNATAKAAYKLELSSSGDPKLASAAVERVAATVDAIREATAKIPGEVSKAVAVEKATLPMKQAVALSTAAANRAGAEHITSEGEYQKSISKLNDSAADATRLHNLIAAAQGGNKAAPGVIPIAELRGFVNRVNQTELRSVSSGAGNLLDRLEGFVGHAVEGQPIPPDILKATDDLAGMQIQQAEQKHAGEVTSINTARHETFKPLKAEDLGYHPATPAATSGPVVTKTKADYDALPHGAHYIKDGKEFIKQ